MARSFRAGSLMTSMLLVVLCSSLACRDNSSVVPVIPATTTGVALVPIASGFSSPVQIAHAGDGSGRLFIVEQQGVIRIIKDGSVLPVSFLDISSRVRSGGEQGLLSVVFPPGSSPGQRSFYVDYTSTAGVGDTVVSRFTTSTEPDLADPTTEQQLLTVVQPFANHNGGQLAFGPDGLLYIGLGDGGSAGDPQNNAQNPASLLGKILRIDPTGGATYTVPANNPFVNVPGFRPEIWAMGLRNPWRFAFDRLTGGLYIGDVGQNAFEEIDIQEAAGSGGQNYGWNVVEGLACFLTSTCDQTGLTPPVHVYDHSQGDCAVTGGFVYRGGEFPALQGVYLYGDFCSGRIWGLRQHGAIWKNELLLDSGLNISTFGEDEAGNLYVADLGGGIYKIIVP